MIYYIINIYNIIIYDHDLTLVGHKFSFVVKKLFSFMSFYLSVVGLISHAIRILFRMSLLNKSSLKM